MSRARRLAAFRLGLGAERRAAWWLRLKGFGILAERFAAPAGEVDLIARRGRLLVFVEVKARASLEAAAEAIGPRQRHRIARAAEAFLARNPRYAGCDLRFDAVLVAPGRFPVHLPAAFDAEG